MKNLIHLTAIIFCLTLTFLAIAQMDISSNQTKKITNNDVRIVKSKPHIFIAYERKGKIEPLYEGQSDYRIWLRFYNNSKWKVKFCSNPIPKEYGETEINYEIKRYEGFGETPGSRRSDTCAYRLLESGNSILFSVPREHLVEGLAIRVLYRYNWETEQDGNDDFLEPEHYVYFYSEDIPKK